MALSQIQILERAERLASTLAGGPTRVEKNVLLAVVADFMSDRQPEIQKLRRTLGLLAAGSGGHLKRGGGYASQIKTVVAALDELLAAEPLAPGEYQSLFGWTARLLLARGLPGPPERAGSAGAPPARQPRPASPASPPRPPAHPPQLGAIDQKGLSALQQLKQEIEKREKDDKA
jgi:hypothetical protein